MTPKEARKLLADNLRSGKYKQCSGQLHKTTSESEDLYCCLGVACETFVQNGGALKVEPDGYGCKEYNGHTITLPLIVQKWLDIDNQGNLVKADSQSRGRSSLMDCNDGARMTFAEIADVIENAEFTTPDAGDDDGS